MKKLGKNTLYLPFLIITFLLTIIAILIPQQITKNQHDDYLGSLKTTQHTVNNELKSLDHFAHRELSSHYQAIMNGSGALDSINATLKTSAYRGNGLVRFIWADSHNIIQLSSHTQHLMEHSDLTHYPFTPLARSTPSKRITSPVMQHPVEALNRSFITYSIGVEHPNYAGYHGTVFATIDLFKLENLIRPLLTKCQCDYRLLSPKGEVIFASVTPPEGVTEATGQFAIEIQPQAAILDAIQSGFYTRLATSLAATYAFMGLIYFLIRHRLIKPVSRAIAIMAPSAAAVAAPTASDSDTIYHLTQLANHYRDMQQQLQQKESQIERFTSIMQEIHAQQARFMQASGSEMQRMSTAINGYAEHLEERILKQQLDPDAAYDFDDVREMGDNLQYISQSYLYFGASEQNETIESADPHRLLRKALLAFEPMMERRNQSFEIISTRDVWITQPGAQHWLSALSHMLLYAAVRFGEDESKLTITIAPQAEKLHLVISVSRFAQRYLPTEKQDFSMFLHSLRQDMRPAMRERLKSHTNIMIAEAIATRLGGNCTIECDPYEKGFHFSVSLANQTQSAEEQQKMHS